MIPTGGRECGRFGRGESESPTVMTDTPMHLGDFTQQAASYDRGRPEYPEILVDDLIAHVGVSEGDPVADVGAGTGIFSRQLAERGLEVVAVEPNPTMREAAPFHERITWLDGTFEVTHLPDHSQRWITAAQSFHWANTARALPELYRVLKPDGCLTVIFNNRLLDANPTLRRTTAIICDEFPEYTQPYRSQEWAAVISDGQHFELPHYHERDHVHHLTREGYLDLWRSINRLHVGAGPEGHARIVQRIAEDLMRRGVEAVEVPYRCCAWTARRRG